MAVDELLSGGAGRRVVMEAGALDAGAVARRGRIVDGEEQVVARGLTHERQEDAAEQAVGQFGGASAGGPEGVVGRAEGVADSGGAEPGGDGASATREQGAEQKLKEAWGGAAVEYADDLPQPGGQDGGKVRQWHGRFLGGTSGHRQPSSCPGNRLLSILPAASCLATPPRKRPLLIGKSGYWRIAESTARCKHLKIPPRNESY